LVYGVVEGVVIGEDGFHGDVLEVSLGGCVVLVGSIDGALSQNVVEGAAVLVDHFAVFLLLHIHLH